MKIVREHINEIVKGKTSAISALGIGKTFLIDKWMREKCIDNYIITENGNIDIQGNLDFAVLAHENLYSPIIEFLPDYIQFGAISGRFDISGCSLLHLRGCPFIVEGSFDCSNNELNSLEFCPKTVGGEFICYNNIDSFTKIDIQTKCNVHKGIFVNEEAYYRDSPEYNNMLTKGMANT